MYLVCVKWDKHGGRGVRGGGVERRSAGTNAVHGRMTRFAVSTITVPGEEPVERIKNKNYSLG